MQQHFVQFPLFWLEKDWKKKSEIILEIDQNLIKMNPRFCRDRLRTVVQIELSWELWISATNWSHVLFRAEFVPHFYRLIGVFSHQQPMFRFVTRSCLWQLKAAWKREKTNGWDRRETVDCSIHRCNRLCVPCRNRKRSIGTFSSLNQVKKCFEKRILHETRVVKCVVWPTFWNDICRWFHRSEIKLIYNRDPMFDRNPSVIIEFPE